MIDYDSIEKFDRRVSTWSREIYVNPDFDKFHGELSFLIKETGLRDIYTTKRASAYINGEYITFDSLFVYRLESGKLPKSEDELKSFVFDAVKENANFTLKNEDKDPGNYVMVLKFLDIGTDINGYIHEITIRSAFYDVEENKPVVQP